MSNVLVLERGQRLPQIRELFWEYLEWANGRLEQEFGISFDTATLIETDMQQLEKFMPPAGRLLLAEIGGEPAGIAALKPLTADIAEVKRMYVRPALRGAGLGRALLEKLMDEAQQIGYRRLRLDSARFMTDAHRLYWASGFTAIDAYEGSEIPQEYREHWVFMERKLPPYAGKP